MYVCRPDQIEVKYRLKSPTNGIICSALQWILWQISEPSYAFNFEFLFISLGRLSVTLYKLSVAPMMWTSNVLWGVSVSANCCVSLENGFFLQLDTQYISNPICFLPSGATEEAISVCLFDLNVASLHSCSCPQKKCQREYIQYYNWNKVISCNN